MPAKKKVLVPVSTPEELARDLLRTVIIMQQELDDAVAYYKRYRSALLESEKELKEILAGGYIYATTTNEPLDLAKILHRIQGALYS